MLNERFLARLHDRFPELYDRANADAMEDAQRILKETDGDVEKALVRARLKAARSVWWPYVKGSVPLVGSQRDAMLAFTRLVLTVDHVIGHAPPTMEAARAQVLGVLRESIDVERLKRILGPEPKEAAAAGAGVVASMTALVSPITAFRTAGKWARFVPVPVRVTLAAVVVAALLSIPFLAGYSAGHKAEQAARGRPGKPVTSP